MMGSLGSLLLIFLAQSIALAGGTAGNGGDSALCSPSAGNSFRGYYSADYLLTLREDNTDLINAPSWPAYRDALLNIFDEKYPDFARLFRDFVARLPGEDAVDQDQVFLQTRLWLEAPYGLVDINDEQIIRKLPPNCQKVNPSSDQSQLVQTVIRQKNGDAIIYNYDPAIKRELMKQPLQYSFLVVHEWLWDFIGDPEVIRRVNRFLHSSLIQKLGTEEFRLSLENLGLSLKSRAFFPVCERTPLIRDIIERQERRPCKEIDLLRAQYDADNPSIFERAGLTTLLPWDFSGLGEMKNLSLAGNRLQFLFEDMFYGLFSLESLDISNNRLDEFPPLKMPSLRKLVLAGNQLREFPDVQLPHVQKLDLSSNQLIVFSPAVLDSDRLRELILKNNQLTAFDQIPAKSNLSSLDLSGNKLKEFPRDLLNNASLLTKLDLSGNQIRSLPGSLADYVYAHPNVIINLRGNQIETLPDGFLPIAGKHDVTNNHIKSLPEAPSIAGRGKIVIDFSHNQIRELSEDWIRKLCGNDFINDFAVLRLTGNPIAISQEEKFRLSKICSNTLQIITDPK